MNSITIFIITLEVIAKPLGAPRTSAAFTELPSMLFKR